jgi:hypothetical protein
MTTTMNEFMTMEEDEDFVEGMGWWAGKIRRRVAGKRF